MIADVRKSARGDSDMGADRGNGDRMYGRLQVSPEASAQQIRHAYRRLAHDVHPDTHPGDPDASRRFQELTEAYELLIDPTRRARYDRQRRPPTDRPVARQPAVVRLGPVRASSAPLIAGPVRVEPPSGSRGPSPSTTGSDAGLTELLSAVLRPWRWW